MPFMILWHTQAWDPIQLCFTHISNYIKAAFHKSYIPHNSITRELCLCAVLLECQWQQNKIPNEFELCQKNVWLQAIT